MPVYHPSALVTLLVRLDDPGDATKTRIEPSSLTPGAKPTGQVAAVAKADPGDGLTTIAGVLPRRVVVTRSQFHEADSCSIVIDYAYLPLDPRWIRGCSAQVYMGRVRAEDYAAGMASNNPSLSTIQPTRDNLRFVGWADEGSWALADGEISLEFRGLQSLLMDTIARPDVLETLDIAGPLDVVVNDLVQSARMARGMRVEVRGGVAVPNLTDTLPRHLFSVAKKGKKGSKGGTMPLLDGASSYWDIITRLCLLVGWVPVVELDTLYLQPSRTAWARANSQSALQVVWGANLESLELSRPWAEVARSPIEVRCWVPDTATLLVSRYPVDLVPAKVAAAGNVATEEVNIFVVSGIRDQATLDQVARNAWFERLSDMRGSFSTRDMRTLDDVDLTGLKAGDTIDIRIRAKRDGGSQPEILEDLSRPDLLALLKQHGVAGGTATAWADVMKGRPRSTLFRVQSAEHTFDIEEGYGLSVEFLGLLKGGEVTDETINGS